MPSTPAARRWVAASLGIAAAALVAVGAFNAYVDPFQQYRIPGPFPARYYTSLHRYIAPGLAKNAAYDTLLSGSSIVENTRNSDIGRACHGTGLNVAMPALTATEQAQIVGTALAAKPLARAILVLDFNEFSGAPDQRNPLAGPMPPYFYDRNPLNDFPYLLSWGVLVKSWRMLTGDRTERFRTDADTPWWWADEKRFARDEVVKRLDPRNLNAQFQQPPRELPGMQESFRRNLLPLFTAYPQTEFVLVWPPYSIVVWADFVQRAATRRIARLQALGVRDDARPSQRPHRSTSRAWRRSRTTSTATPTSTISRRRSTEWLVEEACASAIACAPTTSIPSTVTCVGRRWPSIRHRSAPTDRARRPGRHRSGRLPGEPARRRLSASGGLQF